MIKFMPIGLVSPDRLNNVFRNKTIEEICKLYNIKMFYCFGSATLLYFKKDDKLFRSTASTTRYQVRDIKRHIYELAQKGIDVIIFSCIGHGPNVFQLYYHAMNTNDLDKYIESGTEFTDKREFQKIRRQTWNDIKINLHGNK